MSADRKSRRTARRPAVWSGNSDISLKLEGKSLAVDVLNAASVEAFSGAALDEGDDQVIDAVHAFETIEAMRAARHDDVKTVRQSLCNAFTIRGWRHRI